MEDLRYLRAYASEFGAIPGVVVREDQEPINVLVRAFEDGSEGVRLVVQSSDGSLDDQLLVNRRDIGNLLAEPQTL